MNKFIISYPRSGQHLIERFLNYYSKQKNIEYSYCEFYSCCMTTPCRRKKIFQKNHDLSLNLPIDPDAKYLILYRSNFLEQMESEYRVFKYDMQGIQLSKDIQYTNEQKIKLHAFIRKHYKRYFGFINKWVLNFNTNILKIDYNELILNHSLLKNILVFFFNDYNTDDIINNFLIQEPICKKHNLINCWN